MEVQTKFKKQKKSEYPFFSIKIINCNKDINWFQIIKITSENYSVKNDDYFSKYQNRFLDNNTFIDSPINEYAYIYPFYTINSCYFEDSPVFSEVGNLKWVAKVYAVEYNRNLKYVSGYKWGFEIKEGKIIFINPTKLNETKIFEKYRKIIKTIVDKKSAF
jgi:hypothetical protein